MFHSSEESIVLIDELSSDKSVKVTAGSVEELLSRVKPLLSESLVEHTAACFHFDISSENGHQSQYYLDLSQGDFFLMESTWALMLSHYL